MTIRIAVLSGKGGVGKSSIASVIAKILSERNKVLLLDMDLCGPSIGHIFNIHTKLLKAERGLVPAKVTDSLDIISMSLLIKNTDAVIWRAPKKLSVLQLFYESNNHDFVIYDTPPGISEEHFYLIDKIDYIFVVTTSQNVALSDSIKSLEFARKYNLKVLGVIENMSGLECQMCNNVTNIFSIRGGEELSKECSVPFLGRIPYDRKLLEITNDSSFIEKCDTTKTYQIFKDIISNDNLFN
ncbi:hypothetical protein H312_02010 [Anncaliia algerae PRA339]|uniref:CobQ/CobB/MinD/ParA nucleotide binding domain-containing protein n=1 Tax=Anncaliia algerae PRA339 TaxID=1288291 RepID=A0A059F0C3_9MICR|nr:hypothetical protein H312_02010 [Anncaliia algerae PRA339]